MGIVNYTARTLVNEAIYKPLCGDVLVIGRQTVYMTPHEALRLARDCGLDVSKINEEDLELDYETRIGGENREQTQGQYISDRAFLSILGESRITFLDHSEYEGAEVIVDLNEPAPREFEGGYDVIVDGGCFDNIFNPAQALKNCSMMLRPGGRLLTFNLYSNHYDPYTMLTPNWFIDYFAINGFDNVHIYLTCYQEGGAVAVYAPDISRSIRPHNFNNFASAGVSDVIGIWAIAQKGEQSTWERSPSQRIYRDEEEWAEFEKSVEMFQRNERPYSARSVGIPRISHPPYKEYLFIDSAGKAWPIHEAAKPQAVLGL